MLRCGVPCGGRWAWSRFRTVWHRPIPSLISLCQWCRKLCLPVHQPSLLGSVRLPFGRMHLHVALCSTACKMWRESAYHGNEQSLIASTTKRAGENCVGYVQCIPCVVRPNKCNNVQQDALEVCNIGSSRVHRCVSKVCCRHCTSCVVLNCDY